jgi:hypothetical protein
MTRPFERQDPSANERDIRFLSDESGMEAGEVRDLCRDERARLGLGAKVGHYLAVLTASNVRGMLKRRARQQLEIAQMQHAALPPCERSRQALHRHLQRWEDDGGSARWARAESLASN